MNNKKKSVVITLGCTGTITGFDIDTTGFMDASPSNVLVEGYVENQREEGKVRHAEMRTIQRYDLFTSGLFCFPMYLLK